MITIVYDNELHDKNLESGWGFSCLVEHRGKKILFDTGDDPRKLLSNLNDLKIDPLDFEAIVLSHNHWDHTGGLEALLNKNLKSTLYFGDSFPDTFKEEIKEKGIEFSPLSKIMSISKGIFAGPEMGGLGPREIPLTVQTDKGLVIITGCAHPGIAKMVREVKKNLGGEIYLVLGGFHLESSLAVSKIISELKKLGVKKAGPCHCTGKRAINLFEKEFGENFIRVGAGLKII
jgi:7,8-dihydropterin-6-yl-methyl-4-(beta-D-ribofuranosyl)aminobenzene 5'-phosphate synthase